MTEKRLLPIFLAVIILLLVLQSLAFAAGSESTAVTPPPGSVERKLIMDALRKRWPDSDAKFVVKHLKVNNGWAWIHVAPQSRDGCSHFEDESWLLKKINGQWKEVTTRGTGLDCKEDPDCNADVRFYKKLKSEYPDLPMDILPYGGASKPAASYAGKSILDYYNLIPKKLLVGQKYQIQLKANIFVSRSRANYEIKPLVDVQNGHLRIIDKGTGGGSVTHELSFVQTNDGNNIIGVNLIEHDGLGPTCKLRFYKIIDDQWMDVTSDVLPDVNLSHFLDEQYALKQGQKMNMYPEGIAFIYELDVAGAPIFVHINLDGFVYTNPSASKVKELVRNIKYQNDLFWTKRRTDSALREKHYLIRSKKKISLIG